jgi:hypothetical protein
MKKVMVTIIAMMGLMTATFTASAQGNSDVSDCILEKSQVLTVGCANLSIHNPKSEYLDRRRR